MNASAPMIGTSNILKTTFILLVSASSDPVLHCFAAESESAEHDGKIIMEEKVTAESHTHSHTEEHAHQRRAEAVCSAPVHCICSVLYLTRGTRDHNS